LYMAKCTVLANHYFGFNGWSTKIVQLERLEIKLITVIVRKRTILCIGVVRLEIKDCEFFCDGTGHGGDQDMLQQGYYILMGLSVNTDIFKFKQWLEDVHVNCFCTSLLRRKIHTPHHASSMR